MTIVHGIPNLATVSAELNILRGGEATPEGVAYLKSVGIKRSVKLNLEHDYGDYTGIEVIKCGIDFMDQFTGPVPRDIVQRAVSAIQPNTIIHCEKGEDRTGLVVACYRYGTGWTKQEAEDEMLALGFHKILMGLWHFWEEYQLF